MTPNNGTLTEVLTQFVTVFEGGQQSIGEHAISLITIIAGIELIIAGLTWAFNGSDALFELFRKTVVITAFIGIIKNYQTILDIVIDGFVYTGSLAGGKAASSDSPIFKDPSSIVDIAFVVTQPLAEQLTQLTWYSDGADIFFMGISFFLIIAAFFLIAIQIFITSLEFSLVSTVALIFVPFGISRHTSFLSEKTFGAVIAFGVKFMVLALIISVSEPVLAGLQIPPDASWAATANMVLVSAALAFLTWHAPGVASGLLAGSPRLHVGTAVGAASGAAAGAALTTNATSSVLRKTGSIAKTGAVYAAAGAFSAFDAAQKMSARRSANGRGDSDSGPGFSPGNVVPLTKAPESSSNAGPHTPAVSKLEANT